MKKAIVSVLFAAIFAVSGFAQPETRLKQCPAAFRAFYGKFTAAVLRNDKNGVADMTKFPFRWGFDAGDEGTYTRKQFINKFHRLFGSDVRSFMRQKNPYCSRDHDGSVYMTTEDALHLGFTRVGRSYRFSSYVVEP